MKTQELMELEEHKKLMMTFINSLTEEQETMFRVLRMNISSKLRERVYLKYLQNKPVEEWDIELLRTMLYGL